MVLGVWVFGGEREGKVLGVLGVLGFEGLGFRF